MNLRSLKKAVKVADKPDVCVSEDHEEYPYGLRLNMNNETLTKLKINIDDFDIGDSVMIVAKADIKSKSESDDTEYGENQDMSLQITDMDVKSIGGMSMLDIKMNNHEI